MQQAEDKLWRASYRVQMLPCKLHRYLTAMDKKSVENIFWYMGYN